MNVDQQINYTLQLDLIRSVQIYVHKHQQHYIQTNESSEFDSSRSFCRFRNSNLARSLSSHLSLLAKHSLERYLRAQIPENANVAGTQLRYEHWRGVVTGGCTVTEEIGVRSEKAETFTRQHTLCRDPSSRLHLMWIPSIG